MIKAKSLGITLISSEEFLEMIDKKWYYRSH
jgi:hypothetical protein